MSKVLQERGFGSLPSSTETNPRDQVKSISTAKADFSEIRRIGLDSETKLIGEGDESFTQTYDDFIELNDLETPLETKPDQDDFVPIFVNTGSYKMEFSCVIGYKYTIVNLLPSLPINLMSESFYYSISEEKDEGKSFTIIDDDEMTNGVVLGMRFCKKYASCQRIMKKFALGNNYERINEE
ncbi:hypothetical protein Tco_0707360 [Tanacetum coccineum]|uniref:Uncharacterized protein n=1 Tax=Tanacetum coccineum TaxID=301880 RepID=A0ABQ4Y9Y5_9ASTR